MGCGAEFIREHTPVKKFTEYLGLKGKAQGLNARKWGATVLMLIKH